MSDQSHSEQSAIRPVAGGFLASRAAVLDGIYKMGVTLCGYSALDKWADRCDCKYGFELGKWPTVTGEQTGCPELRSLYNVIAAMADEEWALLVARAGGAPSGLFSATAQTMEKRLHMADAAARMAADQIGQVRQLLTLEAEDC